MSDIIQLLPDHVANQIAAGEVVQRPASVVKELLENSVDSGAKRISLLIKDAGKTLIQVSDDGKGMSVTDARLAFERHATSKIKVAEDLFRLNTKGFRGEALASIAAIAQVDLQTRQESDEVGTQIIIRGSEVISQEPYVTPRGTVVSVKNLFYNIPARRNFLKSDNVETRHIIDEFQRVALAHPQISFTLHHNGSELFQLPISNLRQRIVNVFGGKTNEKLVPVQEETDLIKIEGFIGKPEYAKRTRGEQFFFVNNRFIKNNFLHHSVVAAFEGLLQQKQHPSYFLYFEVNPESIDVNIHPTKTEIKFEDEQSIYAILRSAVRHSLGQFNIAPTLDFKRNPDLDLPYAYKHKNPEFPKIEVDRNFNPFQDGGDKKSSGGSGIRIGKIEKKEAQWESLYSGLDTKTETDFSSIEVESDAVTGSLFTSETARYQYSGIFQLQKKYIVSSLKESILIIHQQRAHYRILYEDFLRSLTSRKVLSQQLLFPLVLKYSVPEVKMLEETKDVIEALGFDFSVSGEDEIKIGGVPDMIAESDVPGIIDDLLADLESGVPDNEFRNEEHLAGLLAKNAAVKSGTSLNEEEQLSVINRLFACNEPGFTPENEIIFIQMDTESLDKNFN